MAVSTESSVCCSPYFIGLIVGAPAALAELHFCSRRARGSRNAINVAVDACRERRFCHFDVRGAVAVLDGRGCARCILKAAAIFLRCVLRAPSMVLKSRWRLVILPGAATAMALSCVRTDRAFGASLRGRSLQRSKQCSYLCTPNVAPPGRSHRMRHRRARRCDRNMRRLELKIPARLAVGVVDQHHARLRFQPRLTAGR